MRILIMCYTYISFLFVFRKKPWGGLRTARLIVNGHRFGHNPRFQQKKRLTRVLVNPCNIIPFYGAEGQN